MIYQRVKKVIYANWLLCSLLTVLILAAMLTEFYPLQFLESKAFDLLAALRKRSDPAPIVIVKVDDKSVRKLGNWPWPRSYIADMINQISEYNPKVIGLYLLYPEKEINPGIQRIQEVREKLRTDPFLKKRKSRYKIDKVLAQAENDLNNDTQLITAVNYAVNLVLPLRFTLGVPEDASDMKLPLSLVRNSLDSEMVAPDQQITAVSNHSGNGIPTDRRPQAKGITTTYEELARKAGALGHINIIADRDATVRKATLLINYKNRYFPAFPLQVAAKYLDGRLSDIKPGRSGLRLKNLDIPTDTIFEMFIDFRASANNFKTVSFADLEEDPQIAASFEGKIVLIGPALDWWTPAYRTTIQRRQFGVEVAATIVGNILQRRHFSRPDWTYVLEILVLLYFGLFLMFVVPKVRPRDGGFILGIFVTTWVCFVVVLFMVFGYWLRIFAPIFLALLGYNITVIKRLADEKRIESMELNKLLGQSFQEKGMLDMAFEKYMQCPVENDTIRDLLYGLGQDFERKRFFNKALTVYQHLLKSGKFRDIDHRIKTLKNLGDTVILSPSGNKPETSLLLNDATTKPTLGRYEIIRELGQGAMGIVYLGMDPKINREVAIKTLSYSEVGEDQLAVVKERFFREAEAAGKLTHPNIVTIYDVGEDYGMAYMAMELLKGNDLSDYCQKGSLLPVHKTLKLVSDVAEALEYAHTNGVIHRDIKPENIILLKNEQVKVADFGIARVMTGSKTQTGLILGTPNYMSPEQVAGDKVDGRTDLFSLGVVLYELLSGERPFKGDNLTHLMYAIANASYIPLKKRLPEIAPCCNKIVDRLLTKKVKNRMNSAAALVKDIATCLENIEK